MAVVVAEDTGLEGDVGHIGYVTAAGLDGIEMDFAAKIDQVARMSSSGSKTTAEDMDSVDQETAER